MIVTLAASLPGCPQVRTPEISADNRRRRRRWNAMHHIPSCQNVLSAVKQSHNCEADGQRDTCNHQSRPHEAVVQHPSAYVRRTRRIELDGGDHRGVGRQKEVAVAAGNIAIKQRPLRCPTEGPRPSTPPRLRLGCIGESTARIKRRRTTRDTVARAPRRLRESGLCALRRRSSQARRSPESK